MKDTLKRSLVEPESLNGVPTNSQIDATAFDPPAILPVGVIVADVESEETDWAMYGWLAYGECIVMDGNPGEGKSSITTDLAARMTRGGVMPDGSQVEAGGAVIVTTEDSISRTIRPRLEAAGADLSKCLVIDVLQESDGTERPLLIPGDIHRLKAAVRRVDATIVIIDPLMAHLDLKTNSYNDQSVRHALAPLSKFAKDTNTVVIVIRHLNKAVGSIAIFRGGGSIGIIGATRIRLIVGTDPEDEDCVFRCSRPPNPVERDHLFRRERAMLIGAKRGIWF